MTFLDIGKTDAERMLKAMDPEAKKPGRTATDEEKEAWAAGVELARGMLETAWQLYEEKAKYIAVGQLYLMDGKTIKQWDPACDKVVIGPFTTERKAQEVATGLAYSGQRPNDQLLTMVLPYFQGTPTQWHKERRERIEGEVPERPGQAERLLSATPEPPRCELEVMNDEFEFARCVRDADHPGHCFAQFPESWGLEMVDGLKRVREVAEERSKE